MKRRTLLLGGLGTIGGVTALLVGWGFFPPRQRLYTSIPLPKRGQSVALNGWVKIQTDGRIVVIMPRSEMGQGVYTALPMLLADELDADWADVAIEQAPDDKIYGNVAMLVDGLPFRPDDQGIVRRTAEWMTAKLGRELGISVTGGSSSVRDAWIPMRQAGAAARAMLVGVASRRWGIDAALCTVHSSTVHGPKGEKAKFAELIDEWVEAGGIPASPSEIRLKSANEFQLIGKSLPRLDTLEKVNGTAQFGIDVRLPDMLYAAIRMAPGISSAVLRLEGSAQVLPDGVEKICIVDPLQQQNGGVAVIARHYWLARKTLDLIKIDWTDSPHASLNSETLAKEREKALDGSTGFHFYKNGDAAGLLEQAAVDGMRDVSAEYSAPYLAHATMEPMNCTAQIVHDQGKRRLIVWAPTQVPGIARMVAARVAQVDVKDVTVHVTLLGGGFGRRLEVDFVAQVVQLATQTPGRPVQLIWSREEDTAHDYYRPAAAARFRARVDGTGRVIAWHNKIACDAITPHVIERDWPYLAGNMPDRTTTEGAFDLPYALGVQQIAHVLVKSPVNIGYWRSVGHSYTAFFTESFIDELSHAVGADPYHFRRGLLAAQPRQLAVLDLAATKHGWASPAGEFVFTDTQGAIRRVPKARGIALHQSFGSIVAEIADITVIDQEIRVHRVTCVVDCGTVVNPGIVRAQMESGIVFGLSAALFGEITIDEGRVKESNFHDYRVLRMSEVPDIEVHIVPSGELPTGTGEPSTPAIAPAVANAVFAATGQRLRRLPLRIV